MAPTREHPAVEAVGALGGGLLVGGRRGRSYVGAGGGGGVAEGHELLLVEEVEGGGGGGGVHGQNSVAGPAPGHREHGPDPASSREVPSGRDSAPGTAGPSPGDTRARGPPRRPPGRAHRTRPPRCCSRSSGWRSWWPRWRSTSATPTPSARPARGLRLDQRDHRLAGDARRRRHLVAATASPRSAPSSAPWGWSGRSTGWPSRGAPARWPATSRARTRRTGWWPASARCC